MGGEMKLERAGARAGEVVWENQKSREYLQQILGGGPCKGRRAGKKNQSRSLPFKNTDVMRRSAC